MLEHWGRSRDVSWEGVGHRSGGFGPWYKRKEKQKDERLAGQAGLSVLHNVCRKGAPQCCTAPVKSLADGLGQQHEKSSEQHVVGNYPMPLF